MGFHLELIYLTPSHTAVCLRHLHEYLLFGVLEAVRILNLVLSHSSLEGFIVVKGKCREVRVYGYYRYGVQRWQ